MWRPLHCRKCRYPLRGLEGTRCPECGTEIPHSSIMGFPGPGTINGGLVLAAIIAGLVAAVIALRAIVA